MGENWRCTEVGDNGQACQEISNADALLMSQGGAQWPEYGSLRPTTQ